MPFRGKRTRLILPAEDRALLEALRRSRTQEKRRTLRAAILLDAAGGRGDSANAAAQRVNRNTVVLCIGLVKGAILDPGTVTVSYDEKPGIQALAVTTPDRPPVPGLHASHIRGYEYKRLGTVSLLAGLDLHNGTATEIVSNTHGSRDFIEFLTELDAAYPSTQTLRLIPDNHSAHISKETQRYLASRPQRFPFVFIPKPGSWLNLVENLFSTASTGWRRATSSPLDPQPGSDFRNNRLTVSPGDVVQDCFRPFRRPLEKCGSEHDGPECNRQDRDFDDGQVTPSHRRPHV